jgi:hypothetical protein
MQPLAVWNASTENPLSHVNTLLVCYLQTVEQQTASGTPYHLRRCASGFLCYNTAMTTTAHAPAGERVRQHHGHRGWSCAEASPHRTYIGQVDGGEKRIGVENLFRIATAPDVPAAALLRGISL